MRLEGCELVPLRTVASNEVLQKCEQWGDGLCFVRDYRIDKPRRFTIESDSENGINEVNSAEAKRQLKIADALLDERGLSLDL